IGFAVGVQPVDEPVPQAAETKSESRVSKTDRYGDPLPEQAIARLGTTRFRPGGTVTAVAFSPDGRLLAAGGYDGSFCLVETANGRVVRHFTTKDKWGPTVLSFSPDGKTLASANKNGTIALLRRATSDRTSPPAGPSRT